MAKVLDLQRERTPLEEHVETCAEKYQQLVNKFDRVDQRFDRLEQALLEIRRLLAAR